ncbi:MAG: cell division protein [Pseudomonadaceae bacterium]|nr:MAG: cell division protein [Pseudomonadaceae bacterium]
MTDLTGVEDFLAHYQLAHDPFAPRTPGFKFFTPKRKSVLAELHHLARYGKQMLAVVAPDGGGKTLLRQALVASSNKDSVQAVVASAREYAGTEALIGFFCQAVAAETRDATALMLRSEQLAGTGMQLYLVVDDAELLEPDALQMLADLRAAGEQAPRIFLFADESLLPDLHAMDDSEMPDGLPAAHVIALEPLNAAEVSDYVQQRLEGAGQGIELLDEQMLASIAEESEGWPGRINQVARELMIQAAAPPVVRRRRRRSAPLIPRKSMIALVLVGLGVLLAWFMSGSEPEPTTTVLQLPETVPVVPAQVEEPGSTVALLEEPPTLEPAEVVEPDPGMETARSWEPVPLPDPIASAPEQAVEAPSPVQPDAEPEQTVAPVASSPAEPEQPAQPAPATGAAAGSVHGADWYRERQGDEFVLQLLGSRSEDSARAFIRQYSGLSDLGLFETRHQGQPWFVVTQGIYPDSRAARQGIDRLPEVLRQQEPWPRNIAGIQQSLD